MVRDSKMAGMVAGLLLAVGGLVIAVSTAQMRVPPMHAKVGPQIFPYVAAGVLILLGIILTVVFRKTIYKPGGDAPAGIVILFLLGLAVKENCDLAYLDGLDSSACVKMDVIRDRCIVQGDLLAGLINITFR